MSDYRVILQTPDVHVTGDAVVVNGEIIGVERRRDVLPQELSDEFCVVITHQKYTRDYSRRSRRPFRAGRKAFKTLGNAVRYALAERDDIYGPTKAE